MTIGSADMVIADRIGFDPGKGSEWQERDEDEPAPRANENGPGVRRGRS
jgi:hypothetical protein